MPESLAGRAMRNWVTLLFVPGNRPAMLAKARQRGADVIVVDLEDAVPAGAKAGARKTVHGTLAADSPHGPSAVCVRINPVHEGADEDIEALDGLAIDAVMLPKAEESSHLKHVRAKIDRELGDPSILLVAQIESARGMLALANLSAVPGVAGLALGGEDLRADLGVSRSAASTELLVPRAMVALHARAYGLAAIDAVHTALDDEEGLIREATLARQLGFSGKLLIHPRQIEPVSRAFGPSGAEVAWAYRVMTNAREADDPARVHLVDDQMVDAPIVAQARSILARQGDLGWK